MKSFLLSAIVILSCCTILCTAQQSAPLLQQPTISSSSIAFSYAGEIWSVARQGGEARLLTSGSGVKSGPMFSPDGKWIAFTGDYEGNVDVYVMPANGGVPRRLTHHPSIDEVVGWTPDSKAVLFRSGRNSYSRFNRLFTVSLEGGLPVEVPLPTAEEGAFSPDGRHLAYVPVSNARRLHAIAWKRYRGGKAARIWLANLSDSSTMAIPREDSNDSNPMWVGDKVYFLSDRNGPMTLFAYDSATRKVEQLVKTDEDIKSAAATKDAIVYEKFGSLHIYDLAGGKDTAVPVQVNADLPQVQPHFIPVVREIAGGKLSPSGARAVFEAHGEILTAPREKGDVRNLTNTVASMERDPAWSPNGKWIAYFSDESGEYELHLRQPDGMGAVQKIKLDEHPTFYYSPTWSPDSSKIAYTDKKLNLWVLDLAKKTPVKIDSDSYDSPARGMFPTWSPDGKWVAYSKLLKSWMSAVFVYSVEQNKSYQVTDGLSDARYPAFDKNGKFLYFTASTNTGPTKGWLDLSTQGHSTTSSVYLAVLSKDEASPLGHENDEEKGEASSEEKKADTSTAEAKPRTGESKEQAEDREASSKRKPVVVKIDFENLGQRILALPMPARNYAGLSTGTEGTVFLEEQAQFRTGDDSGATVYKFDLKSRKEEKVLDGVNSFTASFNGKRVLYSKGRGERQNWFIADADKLAAPGGTGESAKAKPLEITSAQVRVDPRAEWKQMYNEVWRIERDFFYDPNLHGVNLKQARAFYEPYVQALGSRADLNYIFEDMLGELTVGHLYIRSGQPPTPPAVKTGLLGADYKIENGHYRFWRILKGENWNPRLRAPLTEPGVVVHEGDYLLAVNGRELKPSDEIFELFQGTAEKSVVLRVSADANGKDARDVSVVPIDDETNLRNRAWIDSNRAKVDELSGGKIAYVYLPDTGGGGFTSFNRYFFAQLGRGGAVIDERFNGGGQAADYVIDYLSRPLLSYWMTRDGSDFTTPVGAIFGPKVMITNMYAGSGGDALPWYFRAAKVGTLVGTRTWGGLIGIYDYPTLMDGGAVTAPRLAFFSPSGKWEVENHGVAPDVEVELDPKEWRAGHDPQLEKSVELVLQQMKQYPGATPVHPAFPNYHMQTAGTPGTQKTGEKTGN